MNNLIIIRNRNAVTTSLQVAENFEKRHDHVLRDIDALKKDVPNFGEMFIEGETTDTYSRIRKTYFMNRDGFTLLAMGFNGSKALDFKLKYMKAFNEMEQQLKNEAQKNPTTFLEAMELLVDVEKKRLLLEEKVTVMQPKVNYHDNILNNESTMKITQIAKDYGMSATKMNTLLHSLGIQYKQGKTWVLYAKYANEGYTHSRSYEDHSPSTYWTEKGKKFIYETLKNIDVLPLIEGGVSGVKIYQS